MNSTLFLTLGICLIFGLGFSSAVTCSPSDKKPAFQKEMIKEITMKTGIAATAKA